MRSMTGFGERYCHTETHRFSARCRSVNHRNLDVRVFLPPRLQHLELGLNQIVKSYFHRGRIELRIEIEDQTHDALENRFDDAFEHLQLLEKRFGLKASFNDLLALKNSLIKKSLPEIKGKVVEDLVEEVCQALNQSRQAEGDRLLPVIETLLSEIHARISQIERLSRGNAEEIYAKLKTRLDLQIEAWGLNTIDEKRLAEELVFYVDRCDISEEIQRIHSHLEAVKDLIGSGEENGIGKKLDFYMQEFFRETNTIGSKTHLAAITNEVVTLKVTIEKIREQAANIE